MNSPNDTLRIFLKPVDGTRPSLLALTLREFLLDRQARNVATRSIEFYRLKLQRFLDFLERSGIQQPDQITPTHIRQFLVSLQDTMHTPGGQHAHFRAIRAFLNWLEQEGEIAPNPLRRLRAPKVPEELLEPVSLEVVRALLAVCNPKSPLGARDHSVIMALLDTGARASEMIALNIADVDLATGTVLIRSGKGGKPRAAFLGARSLRSLIRYLRFRSTERREAPLWATIDGKRLAYGGLRDIVRRRARAAGVSTPTLHSFRRGLAILSLRNGADVYSLQRLLGHTTLQVLRRYLKQTDTDLHDTHRRTSPVDNLL